MVSQFRVNVKSIVITTQIELNKKYLLSQNEKSWEPITFELTEQMLSSLEENIIQTMRKHIYVNELELLPQLINIKLNDNKEIDIIYGFLVNYTESLNNCFWVEFDLSKELSYSNLILEVIQKLN